MIRAERIIELLFFYTLLILGGMFVVLSIDVFVADSEFWSISLGYHLLDDFRYYWVFTRPLFYFFLWLSQLHYTSPSMSVYFARAVFVANAFAITLAMIKNGKQRTNSYFYGFVSAVLLFGNTGFMNQGFRIRSDLIATTLSLMTICIFEKYKARQLKGVFFLILTPLLATPKALLQSVALGLLPGIRNLLKYKIRIVAIISLVVFFWVALNFDNLTYLKFAIDGSAGNPAYFTIKSFFHIFNQFKRNYFFWALFFTRFLTRTLAKKKCWTEDARIYNDSAYLFLTVFSFLCLIFYTEKVQFFIASLLPFFALHASLIFYDLDVLGLRKFKNILLVLTFLICLFSGGNWYFVNQHENQNRFQLQTLDATYLFLVRNNVSSFHDFNCLIAPFCTERQFVGPNQPDSNKIALNVLVEKPPEVLFYIKKASLLEPGLSEFLNEKYESAGNGVYVRKVNPPQIEISLEGVLTMSNPKAKLDSTNGYMGIHENISGRLTNLFGYDIEY